MHPTSDDIRVVVVLPEGYRFLTSERPFLHISSSDEDVISVPPFELPDPYFDWRVPVRVHREGSAVLRMEGMAFFCPEDDDTMCIFASIDEEFPVVVEEGAHGEVELVHRLEMLDGMEV